jgi:hypothetical protein
MGELALSNIPPNDHLNRRLLIREVGGEAPLVSLLEHLCTDSVYVLKDDFDQGINEAFWINSGFFWDGQDLHGSIFGAVTPAPDEEREREGLTLRSRRYGWGAGHRCVAMIRLRLDGDRGKVEFGFTGREIEDAPAGAVRDKSTPSAATFLNDFAVAIRDTDDDDFFGLVSLGRDNAVGGGTTDRSIPITVGEDISLMVALNEQTESRLWVNGILTTVERSGPSRYAQLGIWLHAGGNTGGLGAGLNVDYIQAWQERQTV